MVDNQNSILLDELFAYIERVSIKDAIMITVMWEQKNPPKELHPKDFPKFDYESEDLVLLSLDESIKPAHGFADYLF